MTTEKIPWKENAVIEELRIRMKYDLPVDIFEDSFLLRKFLIARDFDVDKAEKMLRKHIAWRKAIQVNTILEDFKPKEFFLEYLKVCHIGLDKNGNLVEYSATGNVDGREVLKCEKMNPYLKHWIWNLERIHADALKEIEGKMGRGSLKVTLIVNLDKLTMANVMYMGSGWKEKLLEVIDEDVLPAFLGGKRTDHDGNPLCNTFIRHGGEIPERYFLIDEERDFIDKTRVQKIQIPRRGKEEVSVDVTECGSRIQWEFFIKNKDIGFGLFKKSPDDELEEVLPIQRIDTIDGTEVGSYKCQSTGKYVIVFDNSYSRMNLKEVEYCITVFDPDYED